MSEQHMHCTISRLQLHRTVMEDSSTLHYPIRMCVRPSTNGENPAWSWSLVFSTHKYTGREWLKGYQNLWYIYGLIGNGVISHANDKTNAILQAIMMTALHQHQKAIRILVGRRTHVRAHSLRLHGIVVTIEHVVTSWDYGNCEQLGIGETSLLFSAAEPV